MFGNPISGAALTSRPEGSGFGSPKILGLSVWRSHILPSLEICPGLVEKTFTIGHLETTAPVRG